MTSLGYANVKSSAGGMVHWEEDEYPFMESGVYNESSVKIEEFELNKTSILTIDKVFHDFGEVPQYGGKVSAEFLLKNESDSLLKIGTLTTSCSCTSASVDSSTLDPEETALLTIIFDPDFHEEPLGVFKRTVFMPTNDTNDPESEITIQVDILEGQ